MSWRRSCAGASNTCRPTTAARSLSGFRRARIAGNAKAAAHVETLLAPLARDAALITVVDAHPATLSWLGSVAGHRIYPLGVDQFGQSGDIPDLYRAYGIDTDAILDACA